MYINLIKKEVKTMNKFELVMIKWFQEVGNQEYKNTREFTQALVDKGLKVCY